MKKEKSIAVTILLAAMLAAIDGCFHVLCTPAFNILTGTFAAYGYIHWGLDFYRWTRKEEPEAKHLAPRSVEMYDWEKEETPEQAEARKTEAVLNALTAEKKVTK